MNNPVKRPSKDAYYLDMAKTVCTRGTCLSSDFGAVIIRDDQVVSTGYNGSPRGTQSSQEHGYCLRRKMGVPSGQRYEICRSVHAEQNAIINAARSGVSVLNGDMYLYGQIHGDPSQHYDALPCFICKKMIINAGLRRVICSQKDGTIKIYEITDWVKEWKENDIIDDKEQYGVDYKGKLPESVMNITVSPKLKNKMKNDIRDSRNEIRK